MNSLPRFHTLYTPYEQNIAGCWDVYPRPQLKRDSFFPLNGFWELSVLQDGHEEALGRIRVPYPPESRLSGIMRTLEKGESWIYRRRFTLPDGFRHDRILLHFGAVDQVCRVMLGVANVGSHIGGYLPFTLDVTDYLVTGENELTVIVEDTLDTDIPYGKQCRKRGGMWYTPTSGIWQTVWLEAVPQAYIRALRTTPTLDSITIETEGGLPEKCIALHLEDGDREYRYTGDRIMIPIDAPHHWTPEDPYLYRFTLCTGDDRIESYFALRTLSIEKSGTQAYICLNDRPYFFHGLLDQGYYSDGIVLPASPEGYRQDVLNMKKLGFNMLRKHIKIEPDLYYYYCDLYGMVVFQDMVNSGPYHFLIDTALPTVGFKRGITHQASPRRRKLFEGCAAQTVQLLYNHPCVCYYTIFNEGWGQYDADNVYTRLHALDPSRIWDATSGWFEEHLSDVSSEHIYFRPLKLKKSPDRPIVLSEFGGYVCKYDAHSYNTDKTYGYRICPTPEAFARAMEDLYREQLIPAVRTGLCASVLTQLSDVEDETNGMVTYDRQVVKLPFDFMHELSAEVFEEFRKSISVQ